jgi:hypothetical protein
LLPADGMGPALSRLFVIAIVLASAAMFGCASVKPQTAGTPGQSGVVELVNHLTEITPPKLEFPEWQAAKLDLSLLDASNRKPSNDRDWIDEQKVLAWSETDGERVRVHNVRNAEYFTYRDCVVDYYDKTYDLAKIKSVDFIVIPFAENKAIAHTMLSFGFEGGDYVGVSVEVRLEKGESYSTAAGFLGQFELMYVVADERDLLPVRPQYRRVDVLLYPSKATPAQARALFVDVMKRVNQLHDNPEFYDTLRNNCTTNIVRHINSIVPGEVPFDYRVLLPGYSDELAYDLKLIDTSLPFAEVRRRARVSDLVLQYKDDPRFSERIRGAIVR